MPRANRYILPGYVYHLTDRCHDQKFLLKFAKDREQYRRRLREAVREFKVSLLTYNTTCNHVHLVAYADTAEQISGSEISDELQCPVEGSEQLISLSNVSTENISRHSTNDTEQSSIFHVNEQWFSLIKPLPQQDQYFLPLVDQWVAGL